MDRPFLQPSGPAPGAAVVRVPRPGEVIEGKYRVEKILGEGGMGVVLAAHHELLDQKVAVKVLTATDPKAMSRFSLEAKATAQLKSEHVARVMDVGVLPDGAPFMVMEYLEGCDLEELLRLNGRLPVEETVGYVIDALDGLAQAHALEIIHRDIKPANLFLAVQTSGTSIVKLVDFGISKSIASRSSGKTGVLTGDHSTVGSPTYMAPEQIRSPKDVDARSDIWAIGVVIYELLSGAAPFRGDSVGEIFAAVLEQRPRELSKVVPDVPPELSAIVARCMSDRAERYPNVLELATALAPFGPDDATARVKRIEQTLRAMKAKAEGKDPGRTTGRLTPPTPPVGFAVPGPPSAASVIAASEATLDGAATQSLPASPPPARRKGPAHATAGHVAFTSDTPLPDERNSVTSPSLRRKGGRRTGMTIGGGAAIAVLIALVAVFRSSTPATGVVATATTRPAPSAMPLPSPPPAANLAPTSAPEVAPLPVAPVVPAVAVDALPTARPRPSGAPARKSAAPSSKKHFSVLDSPD
jgi:serine/threonine protein kinase